MKRTFLGRAAVIALPLGVFVAFVIAIWDDASAWHEVYFPGWLQPFGFLRDWILLSLPAAVLFLFVRATSRKAFSSAAAPGPRRIFPEIVLRASVPWRAHRAMPLSVHLPNWGVYCCMILFMPALFFWTLTSRMPTGLAVRLPSRYIAALPRAPESESLGVYVGAEGRFYVNGQLVPRDQLRTRLQDELGRRSFWIVYFEADDDVAYEQVVYAIGTIRGLGAEAYWLTPRVREEFKGNTAP